MADQSATKFDVVISGASFAGLALAHSLAEALGNTLRIGIVDRLANTGAGQKPDARAFALSAATKRMLDVLGVWSAVAAEAQPATIIDLTDSSLEAGIRPLVLSYDNRLHGEGAGEAEGEAATFIVPAPALGRALREIVLKNPAITLIAPAEVVGITTSETCNRILLRDAPPLDAALLIGAEGRRSATREAAGIDVIGWKYDQIAITTTIRHTKPHHGRAVQHFLPGGPFALLPLIGDRCCVTWSEDAAEARRILALDDKGFVAEIDKRVAGRLGRLELAGPRQSWPLEMHLARSYVAPRVALIGDAAHGVHPIAGQGLNLAFRDVAALTEVLADARRLGFDLSDWGALKRYERWRRFDSAVSAATFDALNRLFSNDWTLVRSVRDFGMGLVDRMPALKKVFVAEASGTLGTLPRLLRGEAV